MQLFIDACSAGEIIHSIRSGTENKVILVIVVLFI